MTLRKKPRRPAPSRQRRTIILVGPLKGTISAVLEFHNEPPRRDNASLELRDRRVVEVKRSRNGSSNGAGGHHAARMKLK